MADIDADAILSGSSAFTGSGLVGFLLASAQPVGSASLTATPRVEIRVTALIEGVSALISTLSVVVGFPAFIRSQSDTRTVVAGQPIFQQVDLFLPDGITRAQGVSPLQLLSKLHFNTTDTAWPIVSGVGVKDLQVAAGRVYWEEFSAGYYSLRFFPNQVGIWRLIVTWPGGNQAVSQTYDVVAKPAFPGALGLRASFVK
jgi:hypothetical protein